MIKIGTLELPPEILWIDRYKWSSVFQGDVTTLGGKLIVQAIARTNGRPVTLSATSNQGWLTLSQVEALTALASVPGQHYLFEYGTFSATIVFNHSNPPALDLEPLVNGSEPSDFHLGTIKLITL